MNDKVYILMATYNGEKYLRRQLESIIAQSYKNWILLIRDDLSNDGTQYILKEYEAKDERICVIESKERLGCKYNFDCLINEALKQNAKYVSFSDQDDIWNDNKIEISLREMKKRECDYGEEFPIMVYGNYERVNEHLKHISIARQENDFMGLDMSKTLFLQNPISGSTMLINNSLCRCVKDIPDVVDYHDRWISLLAVVCGKIFYLNCVVEKHIIHKNNLTQRENTNNFLTRIQRFLIGLKKHDEYWLNLIKIYEHLFLRINSLNLKYDKALLNKYQDLLKKKGLLGLFYMFNEKFFMVYKKQTLWIMFLMLAKNDD